MRFDFATFRLYYPGHRHGLFKIAWPWWEAAMDNNPRGERPHHNPAGPMPGDIAF